jgi:hypothetical protein
MCLQLVHAAYLLVTCGMCDTARVVHLLCDSSRAHTVQYAELVHAKRVYLCLH